MPCWVPALQRCRILHLWRQPGCCWYLHTRLFPLYATRIPITYNSSFRILVLQKQLRASHHKCLTTTCIERMCEYAFEICYSWIYPRIPTYIKIMLLMHPRRPTLYSFGQSQCSASFLKLPCVVQKGENAFAAVSMAGNAVVMLIHRLVYK